MPVIVGLLCVGAGLIGLAVAGSSLVRRTRVVPLTVIGIVLSTVLTVGGMIVVARSWSGASAADVVAVSTLPEAPARDGRQLRADRAAAAAWREVRWAAGHLRLEMPVEWSERGNDAAQLDLGPSDRNTFVTARISPAPDLNADAFVRVARLQAASRFAGSRIDGYTVKTLGAASGVLSFERGKDDTREQLTWTGLVPGGNQMITLSLGAALENFAQVEAVLGAILESTRIE